MGVTFRDVNVVGLAAETDYQATVVNFPLSYLSRLGTLVGRVRKSRVEILQGFEGLVCSGEMLVVLGRPGSGASTLLKTLAGQTAGLSLDNQSMINYQGESPVAKPAR